MTKLQKILNKKELSQGELISKISEKYGVKLTRSYVSKVCSGVITNYTVRTALMISETLEIKLDEIIDTKMKKQIRFNTKKKLAKQAKRKIEKMKKIETNSHSGIIL